MNDAAARVAAVVGDDDRRWFRAPGRVNLIGEHTDYNEGFVLPMAIDRACVVAVSPAPSVRVRSLDASGTVEISADGSADPRAVEPAWGRFVAGVVRELAARGRPAVGLDAVLASDVPLGAGLSSSAALEVAVAVALAEVADWKPDVVDLASACRAAEHAATGVPVGIMDQLISLAAVEHAALLIDCRSLETYPVPVPDDVAVLVVHSGASRNLAEGEYAKRRRACEGVARELGLPSLRAATVEQVATNPFGRHVVSENRRVLESATALEAHDVEALGQILDMSHASMRDDFRISTPELDVLVEELRRAGAYGARLTGGGFGGSAVALCPRARVEVIGDTAARRYRAMTGKEPHAFVCRAAAGAGRLEAR